VIVDIVEIHTKRYEVTKDEYNKLVEEYGKDNVIIIRDK
jgi:hypothetical protein